MRTRKTSRSSPSIKNVFPITLAVLLLAGCGALPFANPTEDAVIPPENTPTATLEVLAPVNTPTLEALATETLEVVAPSETPTSETLLPATLSVTDTAEATRSIGGESSGSLVLYPGTTAGLTRGTVQPGQVLTYTLNVAQPQPLTLIMGSTNNGVSLGVLSPTGTVLLNPASKYSRWQMSLSAGGLYTIQVVGGATTADFELTYKLPLPVSFAAGTTSLTQNGTTTLGYLFSYAVRCAAGQTMSASLNVPSTTATINIYGIVTGTLLAPTANLASWTGSLPATQDYVIEVVPAGGAVVNFALTVSCSGTPTSYSTGEITFAQWTTAAVRQGTIAPGQVITYTVTASYAQPIILDVESPNWDVTLGVLDPNGYYVFLPSMNWTHYQTQVLYPGTYTIKLYGGATTEEYTLTTKLARLMNFPNDYQTTKTYYGETTLGYVQTYAFRCSAGQEMTVSLDVDNTKAYLAVFGLQSGVMLDFHAMETEWSGTLPTTETIVVEVIPRGGYLVSYNLTVTIP